MVEATKKFKKTESDDEEEDGKFTFDDLMN